MGNSTTIHGQALLTDAGQTRLVTIAQIHVQTWGAVLHRDIAFACFGVAPVLEA
jgi:hypothetical protein